MNVKLSCQSKSHKQACSFSLVKLQSFRRSVSSLALSWSPPACGFPALNREVLHQGAGFSGYPWLRSVDWSDHRLPILPPPLSCHYQPRALLLWQGFEKIAEFYFNWGELRIGSGEPCNFEETHGKRKTSKKWMKSGKSWQVQTGCVACNKDRTWFSPKSRYLHNTLASLLKLLSQKGSLFSTELT